MQTERFKGKTDNQALLKSKVSKSQLKAIYSTFDKSKAQPYLLNSASINEGIQIRMLNDLSENDLATKILIHSGRYYLNLEILHVKWISASDYNVRGSDELIEIQPTSSRENIHRKEFRSQLRIHVFYKSKRFIGKSVEICFCDPVLNDEFLFEIANLKGVDDKNTSAKLLCINEPLRIMVVREDINHEALGGSLIAYSLLDWRSILVTQVNESKSFPLELMGIGPESNVVKAIARARLKLIPSPRERIEKNLYLEKIKYDNLTQLGIQQNFLIKAKQWWNEFKEIRADHQLRLVRLFAYDEKMEARPVMGFVKPVVFDDLLSTPFQAAWFVSLFSTIECARKTQKSCQKASDYFQNNALPGNNNVIDGSLLSERWQTIDTTIITKFGTVEDHAVLLTSIFLSFGLDAYVALGTVKGKGAWAWTVTLSETQEPTCWESTTGDYYEHYSCHERSVSNRRIQSSLENITSKKIHQFLTVDCLFNAKGIYANVQPTTLIKYINWNLSDPSMWKHLSISSSQESLHSFSHHPVHLTRCNINFDSHVKTLEYQLKDFISTIRRENGLLTTWDESLSQIIGQHLGKLEMEASSGNRKLHDLFHTAIFKTLPPGYEFKGKAIHTKFLESHLIFMKSIRKSHSKDIILTKGDNVKHSLKIKIFSYPENICSIRFMIAWSLNR